MRIFLLKTTLMAVASMPALMFDGAIAADEKTGEKHQAITSSSSSTASAVTHHQPAQQTEETTLAAEESSYSPPRVPPPTLDIAIVGAGLAVTTEWAVLSQSKVSFYSADSTLGATQVCQADGTYNIGSMARPFQPSEALPIDNDPNNQKIENNDSPYLFQCVNSQVQVLQVDVALDALVMIVSAQQEAVAPQCLQASGGGWTPSQLAKIAAYYFFPSDSSSSTSSAAEQQQQQRLPPLWSDLHASCASQNVTLKFAKLEKYGDLFAQRISERSDWSYVDNYQRDSESSMSVYSIHAVLEALRNDGGNILGVVPYRDYIRLAEQDKNSVHVVAIADDATGNLIAPSTETIRLESYPLTRRIQLNLRSNFRGELAKTVPFVRFGFSDIGWQAVESKGFVSLPEADRTRMLDRLATVDGGALEEDIMGPQN